MVRPPGRYFKWAEERRGHSRQQQPLSAVKPATRRGVEAMAMLVKAQVRGVRSDHLSAQRAIVHRLFGPAT